MNRVKVYHELALMFLGLTSWARLIIGTHFSVIDMNEYWLDEDKGSMLIFSRAVKKNYPEFKKLVEARTKAGSGDNSEQFLH